MLGTKSFQLDHSHPNAPDFLRLPSLAQSPLQQLPAHCLRPTAGPSCAGCPARGSATSRATGATGAAAGGLATAGGRSPWTRCRASRSGAAASPLGSAQLSLVDGFQFKHPKHAVVSCPATYSCCDSRIPHIRPSRIKTLRFWHAFIKQHQD